MTISKPSREIYAVDIPEVRDFAAVFRYNFFVPDEGVNDAGGVPESFLLKPSSDIDSRYVQFATTRAPRFVVFNFTPVRLSDVGREVTELDVRNNAMSRPELQNVIAKNLDKIVTEDHFAAMDFVSVQFHDSEIDEKVFYLVSGSLEQHTLGEEQPSNAGPTKTSAKFSSLLTSVVQPHFLNQAMAQMPLVAGVQFHTNETTPMSNETQYRNIRNMLTPPGRRMVVKTNAFFARLKSFQISAQINGKLFHNIVNRTIIDPNSPYGDDLHSLYQFSKQISSTSTQRFSLEVNEDDYRTVVPFIDLKVQQTAYQTNRRGAELVGYIIDKIETTRDGKIRNHPPIVIERSDVGTTADFQVKYDSTYSYAIRTIAKFTIPAIDDETGDIGTIQILVSSKPSSKVYVRTVEKVPPPPPADLNFTWDYEKDRLLVHWMFPTNSQRDIKKFQVFRRKSADHPFELIKMYDFNDSQVRYEDSETPNQSLLEVLSSPCTFYVDDDFQKNSSFIYAVASIDAHGMTSNLSAQYELKFDIFKNKLVKALVSHSGAPKPYPNLYLQTDTFVDTIKVRGPNTKRLRVYFNPEFYQLIDDDERITPVLATKQTGGQYQMQFINLDNHKNQILSINIDDQVKSENQDSVAARTLLRP